MFSAMHALVFSHSPSPAVKALGVGSLVFTMGVSASRNLTPRFNKVVARVADPFMDKLHQPKIDSNGFPLYANGMFLSAVAMASVAAKDWKTMSVAVAFALANAGKGAAISGAWKIRDIGKNVVCGLSSLIPKGTLKSSLNSAANNPAPFINNTIYLPEMYASIGAIIVGVSGTANAIASGNIGPTAITTLGTLCSLGGLAAAMQNNGDALNPKLGSLPVIGKYIKDSDQVISRRMMKYGSLCFAFSCAVGGSPAFAVANGCAVLGNARLEAYDKQKDQQLKTAIKIEEPK